MAARADGPKTGMSIARSLSASPATSGPSGPNDHQMRPFELRQRDQPLDIVSGHGLAAGDAADIPGLPGAATISVTLGLCFSRQARACSRPPPPTMRIFM